MWGMAMQPMTRQHAQPMNATYLRGERIEESQPEDEAMLCRMTPSTKHALDPRGNREPPPARRAGRGCGATAHHGRSSRTKTRFRSDRSSGVSRAWMPRHSGSSSALALAVVGSPMPAPWRCICQCVKLMTNLREGQCKTVASVLHQQQARAQHATQLFDSRPGHARA